ncbi:MAG: response regulator transcription factor [Gemmatimonadetes bacterium]|nr:response regulator transcription factor [Gemmatimonadota bacterium]
MSRFRSRQLPLFPAEASATGAGEEVAGALRIQLLLSRPATLRAAWAAVNGHPGVQVVSTGPGASAEADVTVEAVSPCVDGRPGSTLGADAPNAARRLAIVPDETDEAFDAALSRGAWAVVAEMDIPLRLLPSLLAIGRGECPILCDAAARPALARPLLRGYRRDGDACSSMSAEPNPLTEREAAILEAIAAGQTSAAIARRLGLGVQTVKNHTTQILRKTGAHTRAEALAAAVLHGWVLNGARGGA